MPDKRIDHRGRSCSRIRRRDPSRSAIEHLGTAAHSSGSKPRKKRARPNPEKAKERSAAGGARDAGPGETKPKASAGSPDQKKSETSTPGTEARRRKGDGGMQSSYGEPTRKSQWPTAKPRKSLAQQGHRGEEMRNAAQMTYRLREDPKANPDKALPWKGWHNAHRHRGRCGSQSLRHRHAP